MRKITTLVAGVAAVAAAIVPSATAAGMPSATLMEAQTNNKVVLTASLANFAIDGKNVGMANMAGMGHLHFQVDGGKYDYEKYSGANGALAAKLGIAGKYSPSVTPSVTYTGLPVGKHTAMVFIVNNDHSNTGASAKLAFTVVAPGKSAASLAATQTGKKVVLTANLANFTIDAKDVGMANMAGMGHLHFQVDGGKYDYEKYSGANGALAAKLGIAGKYSPSVTPSVTYTGLPAGKHTAKVFIVNNDHSNTGAQATLVFTVK